MVRKPTEGDEASLRRQESGKEDGICLDTLATSPHNRSSKYLRASLTNLICSVMNGPGSRARYPLSTVFRYYEQIVMECPEKLAYGYRERDRAAAKKGLPVNRKRMLRVMGERGLHVRSQRLRARRRREWKVVAALTSNQVWRSDKTQICARSTAGWAYLVNVIDRCT